MVLFIMLYKVVQMFESVDEVAVTIQIKATKQYFHMELFIMPYTRRFYF